MPILVPITLFGWVFFTIFLFYRLPPHRAVLVSVIAGWLFLPVAGYNFPGIPEFDKNAAISIGLILGGRLSGQRKSANFKWSLYDLPMIMWLVSPVASSLSNGLGLYNGLSGVYSSIMVWGIPYLAGRAYFCDNDTLRDLCLGIVIGGMVYAVLCLWEIRMSPRLSINIYGFFPHEWRQHRRYGGWRPIVFMQHGLMVAVWMAACTTMALWLWRSRLVKQIRGIPMGLVVTGLFITTLLCKAASGWIAVVLGCSAYFICRRFQSYLPILALLLIVPLYIGVRTTGTISITDVENIANRVFDAERTDSLVVRLTQEDLFAAKAMDRPLFGWGRASRAWPVDPYTGRLMIAMWDSLWIIFFSLFGYFGLFTWAVGMLIGPWAILRRSDIRVAIQKNEPASMMPVVLSLIVIIFMIDSLFNGMVNPVYILCTGTAVGFHLAKRRKKLP